MYDINMPNRYNMIPAVAHPLPAREHRVRKIVPATTPSMIPAACDHEFHNSSLCEKCIFVLLFFNLSASYGFIFYLATSLLIYTYQLAELWHSHNHLIFSIIIHSDQDGAFHHTKMVHFGHRQIVILYLLLVPDLMPLYMAYGCWIGQVKHYTLKKISYQHRIWQVVVFHHIPEQHHIEVIGSSHSQNEVTGLW